MWLLLLAFLVLLVVAPLWALFIGMVGALAIMVCHPIKTMKVFAGIVFVALLVRALS